MSTAIKNLKTPSSVTYNIIHITPAIAEEYLTKNDKNRNLSATHVSFLAAQMTAGEWRDTGDNIKFDTNGKLIDGQHRLAALVQSGMSFDFIVAQGFDPEVINYLDTGKIRNASDVLRLNGHTNTNSLAALVKLMIAYDKGYYADTRGGHRKYGNLITNNSVLEYCESNHAMECLNQGERYRHEFKYLPSSQLGFLYYVFSRIDQEDCLRFMDGLCFGIGLTMDSPVRLCREKLIDIKMNKSGITWLIKLKHIFRAWNYWRKGKSVKSLIITKDTKLDNPK